MRRILISAILLWLATIQLFSEDLLISPPYASQFEPLIGFIFQDGGKLRLDIGTSLDLFKKRYDNSALASGIDFFTFTRLRSEGNFKFPVETSDYFFGVNSTYKTTFAGNDFALRVRLAHISSHLVDGLADSIIFRREPFVYSREFLDVIGFYSIDDLRLYAGAMLLFSTIPKDFSIVNPQLGADYTYEISKPVDLQGGIDYKALEINGAWKSQLSINAGVTLRTFEKMGITLFMSYFEGASLHGMFYDESDKYFALGIEAVYY